MSKTSFNATFPFASVRRAVLVLVSLVVASAVTSQFESVAQASNLTATFFISAPGVEGPRSIPGLSMETFDALTPGNKTSGTALAIGTISANSLNVYDCSGSTCWAGAATSNSTPIPSVFSLPATTPNSNYPYDDKTPFAYPAGQVTIDLARAVNYFGFYWAAGSGSNTVKLFSGNTLVASFSTVDLNTLIPTSRAATNQTVAANGGGTYNVDDYRGGHKNAWDSWYTAGGINCALASPNTHSQDCWNPQQFAYVHAVVPQGVTFNKVQLIANDFEFDNLAIANYTGTFDPTGLVGIPLTGASVVPTLTTTSYSVTFDANDGSGATETQSAAGSVPLRANTFARGGYTFAGWATASTSSVIDYDDEEVFQFTAATTLYAQWTPIAPDAPAAVPVASAPTSPVVTTTAAPLVTTTTQPISTPVVESQLSLVGSVTKKKLPETGINSLHLSMLALGMVLVGQRFVFRRRFRF